MYIFEEKLREGIRGEKALDACFAPHWSITPATSAEQRRGIDRHYQHRVTGQHQTVEYKTDYTAGHTHNTFLETVSVDSATPPKPGWVYTCQADFLFYYVPDDGVIYILRPARIRHFVGHLSHWRVPIAVPNRGYHTWGFVVPLRSLERLAESVISV